ncbi:MAG: alkaline phosphatase [Emcibacteraceae bacterium]|nr:alkaline phosphatase [Emcibacteraceae bacterium]
MIRTLLLSGAFLASVSSIAIAAPKNIILLIGDGMGEAEIALTRAYESDGKAGLYVDTMKSRGSVIVNQLMVEDPTKIQFVGESASGGTTISTGQRTSDGRVAVSAFDGSPIKTIMEQAIEHGYKTGLVTTSAITDATPATFAAHAQNRYCWKTGDEACSTHNDRPIVEQMLDLNVDVMLGGGQELLPAMAGGGGTVEQKAEGLGYKVIQSREALLDLKSGTKVFGVFGAHHMPVEWQGPNGVSADIVQIDQSRTVIFPDAVSCEANPAHEGIMPRLEEMAQYALDSLGSDEGEGFFLMIEGASIDKQTHIAKPCGTIGEMLAFDRTVEIAVNYAKKMGNTVVIVTADHGQATQVIYKPEAYTGTLRRDHIPGLYQLLRTKGGNELGAYYGTNNINDQAHTGINVPVYSYGLDNPEDLMGVIQQTEIYTVMAKYLFE